LKSVVINENYAYVGGSSAFHVFDITDNSNPDLLGTCDTPQYGYGVGVSGDYAYVADATNGIQVISGIGKRMGLSGTPGYFDMGQLNLKAIAANGFGTASTAFMITVLENTANTRPTIEAIGYEMSENSVLQFGMEQFADVFHDFDGNPLTKIMLATLPVNGTIKLLGSPITSSQSEVAVDRLDEMTFVPQTDWAGGVDFFWRGFDGITYSDPNTVTITVDGDSSESDGGGEGGEGVNWNTWGAGIGAAVIIAAVTVPCTVITAIVIYFCLRPCKRKDAAENIAKAIAFVGNTLDEGSKQVDYSAEVGDDVETEMQNQEVFTDDGKKVIIM